MRISGLSSQLNSQVGTLATTVADIPGTDDLSRRLSGLRSETGRLAQRASGAVSDVESVRARAAAINRTGEVERGRVALGPVSA